MGHKSAQKLHIFFLTLPRALLVMEVEHVGKVKL